MTCSLSAIRMAAAFTFREEFGGFENERGDHLLLGPERRESFIGILSRESGDLILFRLSARLQVLNLCFE